MPCAMHMHTKVRHARKPSATRSYRPAETSRCPPPVDQSRAPDLRNTHFAPPSVGMKINALAGVLRRVFTHHEVIIDPLDREHRLGLAVVDVYVAHKVPQAPHRSPICVMGRGLRRVGLVSGCPKGTRNARGGWGACKPAEFVAGGHGRGDCDETPKAIRRRLGGSERAAGSHAASRRRVPFDLLPAVDLHSTIALLQVVEAPDGGCSLSSNRLLA